MPHAHTRNSWLLVSILISQLYLWGSCSVGPGQRLLTLPLLEALLSLSRILGLRENVGRVRSSMSRLLSAIVTSWHHKLQNQHTREVISAQKMLTPLLKCPESETNSQSGRHHCTCIGDSLYKCGETAAHTTISHNSGGGGGGGRPLGFGWYG